MQYYKYSLTEIKNMIPWERDIYVTLLQNHLEEEKLKQEQQNAKFLLINRNKLILESLD